MSNQTFPELYLLYPLLGTIHANSHHMSGSLGTHAAQALQSLSEKCYEDHSPAPCSLCPVPAGETPSRGHFVREDTATGVHRVESLTHSEDPDTQESRPHPRPLPLHLPTSTEKSPLLTAEGTHRGSRAPATREGTHRGGTRSPAQKGTGLPGASTALT